MEPNALGSRLGRMYLAGILAAAIAAGCSLVPSLSDAERDSACRGRPDAADCQAALDAATQALGVDFDETYTVTVAPITCDAAGCSTWVSAVPNGEECRPSWDSEVVRPAGGQWTVGVMSHGDPACAFEP